MDFANILPGLVEQKDTIDVSLDHTKTGAAENEETFFSGLLKDIQEWKELAQKDPAVAEAINAELQKVFGSSLANLNVETIQKIVTQNTDLPFDTPQQREFAIAQLEQQFLKGLLSAAQKSEHAQKDMGTQLAEKIEDVVTKFTENSELTKNPMFSSLLTGMVLQILEMCKKIPFLGDALEPMYDKYWIEENSKKTRELLVGQFPLSPEKEWGKQLLMLRAEIPTDINKKPTMSITKYLQQQQQSPQFKTFVQALDAAKISRSQFSLEPLDLSRQQVQYYAQLLQKFDPNMPSTNPFSAFTENPQELRMRLRTQRSLEQEQSKTTDTTAVPEQVRSFSRVQNFKSIPHDALRAATLAKQPPARQIPQKLITSTAEELNIDPSLISAILYAESYGGYTDTLRYEPHKDTNTSEIYGKLLNRTVFSDSSNIFEQDAWLKAQENTFAAISWGAFQIMGANYSDLKFSSVGEMVEKMQTPEGQAECFIRYVRSKDGLLPALQSRDFPKIAQLYNGPAYAKNKYDTKLQVAYERYAQQDKLSEQAVG